MHYEEQFADVHVAVRTNDDGSVTGIVRPEAMIEVAFRLSKREAVRLGRQLLRAGEGKRTGGLGTLSTTRGD